MSGGRLVALVAFAALALALGGQASPPAAAQLSPSPAPRPRLFKSDRQSIAMARAQGRTQVVVLLVTRPGAAPSVAEQAVRLGGDVRHRDDEVGYLRVRISPERATQLAELDQVEAATVDHDDSYPYRLGAVSQLLAAQQARDAEPQPSPPVWPPRLGDYPLQHPYSPLADLDAARFLAEHPTWDGRGVTIAVLDGNPDLLLPEFQTAYALDGSAVPKFADFLNLTDPRDDAALNPQWVDMRQIVSSRGGSVELQGKTFTAPDDGTYRIGFFSERRFNRQSNGAYIEQDIDRNGNPKGDDGLFGVLWNEETNEVWVDTDRDASFADEKAMTDYIERHDVGVFGKDDPETLVRETIGFAVQTDPRNEFVAINVGLYQHATIILGSVVGNRQPHGRVQGVAPGARVASMFYGVNSGYGLIEGLIAAFKHPLVDLVVLEQSVAIASLPYLIADGTHPISIVAQRLIDRYGKLLFVPGDNLPAFGFVAEDGLAPGAVSVGGYQSAESYRVNWGFVPNRQDNLHWGALSHGPSGHGALKPDLLAPSGQLSTDPGYRKGWSKKGLYQLPPGYAVDGGTSTATPMAAGAAALVVSAAKQSGLKYDAPRLKAAITGGARWIPDLAAHEQGNGLIQVGAAVELLKKLQTGESITVTSRGPVATKLSHLLAAPHVGVGLYEREGWSVGDRAERTIFLTRTSGAAEALELELAWQGNDGTFSSPESVVLPLHTEVGVPVTITAKSAGAHSAILSVRHPSLPTPVHRVLATIVVPHRFTDENGYTVQAELKPPATADASLFVEVPPGAAALSFSASLPDVRLSLIGPDKDLVPACSFGPNGSEMPCAVARPQPGTWEINVTRGKAFQDFDPDTPVPFEPSPVAVTATLLGVDFGPPVTPTPLLAVDASLPLTLGLENRFGKVTVAAATADLGSGRRRRATIAPGEQHLYELRVPKGTTTLLARVTGASGAADDLDVYLFDCTEPEKPPEAPQQELETGNKSPAAPAPTCGTRAKAADVGPGGEVEVAEPRPGRWVVVVDAYSLSGGGVEYDYLDLFTHPSFGALTVADVPEERASGSEWTVKANAWVASLPDPPRRLVGRVIAESRDVAQATGPFGQGPKSRVPLAAAELWFEGRER